MSDNVDGIQLKNSEWLKGEIEDPQDEAFTFDWEDSETLYSPHAIFGK